MSAEENNRTFHQRISKFITKVKEKTQNVFIAEDEKEVHDEILQRNVGRRHSSYVQTSPIVVESDELFINFFDNKLAIKQDNNNAISIPQHTDTFALSPPPRQFIKKDGQKNNNTNNNNNNNNNNKPCLSRSNTLGHHPTNYTK